MIEPAVLLDHTVTALEDAKAKDLTVLDVRGKTPLTDYIIVASGTSTRHLKSLADAVSKMAREQGHDTYNREGDNASEWVLVDLADVIVHLFMPQTREFYNLEKLWSLDVPSAEAADQDQS